MSASPTLLLTMGLWAGLITRPGEGCPALLPSGGGSAREDSTSSVVMPLRGSGEADDSVPDTSRRPPSVREPVRPAASSGPLTVTVVTYHHAVREHDVFAQAIPQLLAYLREATRISVPLAWNVRPLFSPQVQEALLLYMTGQDARLQIAPVEKQALGKYLHGGGLLFGEDIVSGGTRNLPPRGGGVAGTPFDRQFKALIADPLVLGPAGRRWRPVPLDHPLYHLYFDFPDGPPLAASYAGNVRVLEMLEYRGRVTVIFSDLNLSWFWANPDAEARARPLQLGVNILVQALAYRYAGSPLPVGR